MVQFVVDKKALGEAAIMLAQVANLKSVGAAPSESSRIYLTPTTMTLVNSNEANCIMVEHIPIKVTNGDISSHVEQAYMINTKKFSSIIKGSTVNVNFLITESKVSLGEGSRKFDLAIFNIPKQELPAITLFDHKIEIKHILKNLIDTDLITANATNITELSGTLFTKNLMLASDRLSALYIENGGLFAGVALKEDIVITTDLFSTCLTKTKETDAFIGFTEDSQSVVLKFGNITLTKRILTSNFPKENMMGYVSKVRKGIERGRIKATVNLKEFMEKLHEVKEIVEAENYHVKFQRDGTISIESSSVKSGADGTVHINATVNLSEELGDVIGGKFSFLHLELFGKLFSGENTIELYSSVATQEQTHVLQYLAVVTGGKMFFCTPKV